MNEWVLNTSNEGKLREFQTLFAERGAVLSSRSRDLKEIHADPISVVVHKACQMGEGILVEDTSLDIEGAEVGINVRWLFDHLQRYVGREALWRVLLAQQKGDFVYIYEGKVEGTIVLPRGSGGFGFDPIFLPKGFGLTLAESKIRNADARADAVSALFENRPIMISPLITEWNGKWQ